MPPKYARSARSFEGRNLLNSSTISDLAKVESGKIDLKPERVQLAGVVEDVTSITGGLARQRDIRIETVIAPDIGDVYLDPNRLKQVLYNYLSNAIKFSREQGRVEVRVAADGPDHFTVEVEDWASASRRTISPSVRRVSATRREHGEAPQGNRAGPGAHEADRGSAGWIRWRSHGDWGGQHVLRTTAETRHRPHGRRDVERRAYRIGSARVRGACE